MRGLDLLELPLTSGWNERPRPDRDVREFWADPEGETGVLQVSELDADNREFARGFADLGVLASGVGERLGDGWGRSTGSTHGSCAMGRFGLATFSSGAHASMLLFVTLSDGAAFMWTWLGPTREAAEVREALEIVMNATVT